jgi:uncharacterized membrane protein (UPF0136 family)
VIRFFTLLIFRFSLMKSRWFGQLVWILVYPGSASARISKGQGYQGFLRKRAGRSFGQKRVIGVIQGKTWKTDRISLLLGSIKCFPLSFNTFKTLLRAGHPLGSKRAQGCPLVAEGHGALLKMPSRSTVPGSLTQLFRFAVYMFLYLTSSHVNTCTYIC